MSSLKEKFKTNLSINTDGEAVRFANQCVEIADDYAIEFAEWLYRWDNTRLPNGNWIIGLGLKAYTSEEVLVKFKKEKGL